MERVNSGVIFRNNYKKQDSHPDWKGTAEYNGVKFDIALWEKHDKNGNVFFSVKTSEVYVKQDQQVSQQVENLSGPDDDGLPF